MLKKNTQHEKVSHRKPVVLMSMGAQERKGHDYQVMTVKYIKPLAEHAGCVPLLAPTCCGSEDIEQYLSMVDGVYLTGAGSNIDPALYGQENLTPDKQQDPNRDNFDIPLIHAALKMGLPIFAICRGMQELNVALGGDLHQKLYAEPNMLDHREDGDESVDEQYADAHQVRLVSNSWLSKLLEAEEIPVNSLHGQSIKTLGAGVQVLAHAEDGAIEAIHLPEVEQFTLGVQWHPEWKAAQNPNSIKIFAAFGDACRLQVQARS
ncbi:gamma-glutamyl-gamma-aminobutyrate hydrolase family protein [Solimicrobium silvestre]|uniref:gamma-glutamyl-gamma-aminobutyrate hydrolase n=1 Tax=Solimicrobium silvestre TaxID=2099400 RepID=A0A2S9GVR6_9BURK|nr:gamma-glutamyl-gamma-aminobutyrate hydrolase family protein [Solimicrobium silvestre]PRC91746.1 putative glutamine amidotransferase [Solimicrobium silvestre]